MKGDTHIPTRRPTTEEITIGGYGRCLGMGVCQLGFVECLKGPPNNGIADRRESDGGPSEFPQELDSVLAREKLYSITWSGYGRLIDQGRWKAASKLFCEIPASSISQRCPERGLQVNSAG